MTNSWKDGHPIIAILLILVSLTLLISPVKAQEGGQEQLVESPAPSPPQDEKATVTPLPTPLPVLTPLNLTVSPVILNLESQPGIPVTTEIRLLNNSSAVEVIEFQLATFDADASGAKPIIRDFTDAETHRDWLKPESRSVELQPGQWKTVPVTFSPPIDAGLSYYYALIARRMHSVETTEATTVTGAPAILVLARVNVPSIKQELQMVNFSTDQKVYEFLPATFRVNVQNSGNVHLAPIGNIFIDQGEKKDVGILSINPENGLVLPNSEREFVAVWADGFPKFSAAIPNGDTKKGLEWDFSTVDRFRFGKFTANVLMVYDNGTRDVPIEASVSFWVVPWRMLLVLLLILSLISMGIWFIIRTIVSSSRGKQVRSSK